MSDDVVPDEVVPDEVEPDDIDDFGEQKQYQQAMEELRQHQERQGQQFVIPETDLEFESKVIDPEVDVRDVLDPKKFESIRKKIVNLITVNLTTSNYNDNDLREMRLGAMAAIKVLDAMIATGKDLSSAYNQIALNLQADATLFKAHNGWANIMARSEFREAKTLESMVQRIESETEEPKRHFNLPLFKNANKRVIVQSPSRTPLR